MIARLRNALTLVRDYSKMPSFARVQLRHERRRRLSQDVQPDVAVSVVADWLCDAQDSSKTADGGIARHFSLLTGWGSSYPETTGYIVPTFLELARRRADTGYRHRAYRMLDWLAAIQLPSGGFQGGMVDEDPVVAVTFNTGQILLGFAAAVSEGHEQYRERMCRAADWLASTQDDDGAWRRHGTPFATPGEKAYETHVAWGLFETHRVEPRRGYAEAGLRNVRWAIGKQRPNGWVADCCLSDARRPLTHTLGYFLRGVLESYRLTSDAPSLDAAVRLARGLHTAQRADGALPGRLYEDWSPAVASTCLTGNVQIAHCWLMLFQITGDGQFLTAARAANAYVRRTIAVDGPAGIRGGVRGSFPIWGDYGTYEYLNWAAKFFIDSQLLESDVLRYRESSEGRLR